MLSVFTQTPNTLLLSAGVIPKVAHLTTFKLWIAEILAKVVVRECGVL